MMASMINAPDIYTVEIYLKGDRVVQIEVLERAYDDICKNLQITEEGQVMVILTLSGFAFVKYSEIQAINCKKN